MLNFTEKDQEENSLTSVTLRAEVKRVVFASENSSYAVVKLTADDGKEIVAIGDLALMIPGQEVLVNGNWEFHKEHGRQLRITNYRAVLPTTEAGIIRYLSSGVIPGVGAKTAEKIVDKFGVKTLEILEKTSARLSEIEGLGKNKIKQIKISWDDLHENRELDIFLQGLGVTPSNCVKLRDFYKGETAKIVRDTPYRVAVEVKFIGFITADKIAMAQGMSKESPVRIAAGIAHVLRELSADGHVCSPADDLCEKSAELLNVDINLVSRILPLAIQTGAIVGEKIDGVDYAYLKNYYNAEIELAAKLDFLLKAPIFKRENQKKLEIESSFTNEQKLAIENAFSQRISIITGGPGVGKTTTVAQIVNNAKKRNMKIFLAAPTGRAAKRMSEGCNHLAQTLHRLLAWDSIKKSFYFNEENPLKCDILIVDEVSMLDLNLARGLLRAIILGTNLVLVGDKDQLPSVGAGNVFADLINCNRIKCTHLTQIFRQAEGSKIITNAHSVNSGKMPNLKNPPKGQIGDFYWINQDEPEKVNETIVEMLSKRIPEKFNFESFTDIQILTPMNGGTCGTQNLNNLIQNAINPNVNGNSLQIGERSFREKDKVMQRVNNYDKGVFNGDIGFISAIYPEKKKFLIIFDDKTVEYEFSEYDQISLAYAVTIHKSQGSEYPCIIVPILTQHFIMLQKNLIYTAMTRAKKLLIMIGTEKAMRISVSNSKQIRRFSNLVFRLKNP